MAKLSWNKFTKDYPKSVCLGAAVSKTLPKGYPRTDTQGLKLPTPPALLQEVLKSHISGDWAYLYPVLKIADSKDLSAIASVISVTAVKCNEPDCGKCYRLSYRDTDYVSHAKKRGYKF